MFVNLYSLLLTIMACCQVLSYFTYPLSPTICNPVPPLFSLEPNTVVPPRRQRYSGTYPKMFSQKYKEIRGDNKTIEKVLEKGSTPAGMHIPVMLSECISHLRLDESSDSSVSLDCTLGYGGHTLEMLKRTLTNGGRHIALDQDPIEMKKTVERLRGQINTICNKDTSERFMTYNRNFRHILEIVTDLGLTGKITNLLADLGYSSMQVDDPTRGFTYKFNGPLDMRMDPVSVNETASQIIDRLEQSSLCTILRANSDEEFADEIADTLIACRPVCTTTELAKAVKKACIKAHNSRRLAPPSRDEINSAVARTMQALRIEVNQEFAALDELLNVLPRILAPGGRAVILTFHSGEDRRVKKSFKSGFNGGLYSSWSRDVVIAGPSELRSNPRSKCAKLRWVVRSDERK